MRKKSLVFLVCFFLVAGFVLADFVTVTPAAFDDDDDNANAFAMDFYGTYVYDSGGVWFIAPIHLPDGEVLGNMRLHYIDNTGIQMEDIFCNLLRINKHTGTRDYIFQVSTAGPPSGSIRSVVDISCSTPAWRLVRNGSCNYYVMIGFGASGSNLRVYGVTVEY